MLDLLFLAIAPAVFLFVWLYAKDRYDPEPLGLVLWVFLLGALVTIPAGLLEIPFGDTIITSCIVAPVVEELAKFLVVYLAVYRHGEFDEPADGIVYAMAAALGFAMVENIFYVIDGGLAVGIFRAFASVPGHVIFSCIWGAALGMAKFRPKDQQGRIILSGLLGAIVLHAFFNFSIEAFGAGALLVFLVFVPAGLWWTNRNIACAHTDPASACSHMKLRAAPAAPGTAGPAPGPGHTTPQRFCTECGSPLHEGMAFCENCGKKG